MNKTEGYQPHKERRNTRHAPTLHHLEKYFDDLLQDGQQPAVVNTHTAFQQRQDGLHLNKNVKSDKFGGVIQHGGVKLSCILQTFVRAHETCDAHQRPSFPMGVRGSTL